MLVTVVCLVLLGSVFDVGIREAAAQAASAPLETPDKLSNLPSPKGQLNVAGPVSLMSNREFWLSIVILTFGLLIILVEYFLLRTVVQEKTEEIARTYTVTLIIIGTLVLIASGFTNEQIAPALGLFGTIAGYLLGKTDLKSQVKERKDDEDSSRR